MIVDNFSLISAAPLIAATQAKSKIFVQANDKWLIYGLRTAGQGLWHTPQEQASTIASLQSFIQPLFRGTTRKVPILVNSHFLKNAYVQSGFKPEQLHEAIEYERRGLLVRPGDPLALAQAILKLVRDSALRCRLSTQASASVRERWSFRRYVDTLEAAYQTYAMDN